MISYQAFSNATLLLELYEMQLHQANATPMLETKNGIKHWHNVVWQMQPLRNMAPNTSISCYGKCSPNAEMASNAGIS